MTKFVSQKEYDSAHAEFLRKLDAGDLPEGSGYDGPMPMVATAGAPTSANLVYLTSGTIEIKDSEIHLARDTRLREPG